MASLRRAKTFQMDNQTRFLYLILKQLDLKTVNWQHVADDLGIKNGHAARMRWSRFKQHVEGVPAAAKNRKDEGKSGKTDAKGKCMDMNAETKRHGDDMARDDDDDGKRLKMEQGWPPMSGGYGHGPPPPYYPGHHPYGISPPHHTPHRPSFGPQPPGHFPPPPLHGPGQFAPGTHVAPMLWPPPPQHSQVKATAPLGTINPVSISKPATTVSIKPEPKAEPKQDQTKKSVAAPKTESPDMVIKPEPGKESTAQPSQPLPVTEVAAQQQEPTPPLPIVSAATPVASVVPLSIPSISTNAIVENTAKRPEDMAINESALSASESSTLTSTKLVHQQPQTIQHYNNCNREISSALAEVSKEDFTKAVDAEAAARATPVLITVLQDHNHESKQKQPGSPYIPLASVRAHTTNQVAAPVIACVSNQFRSVTSGIVARATSQVPPAARAKPPPPAPAPQRTVPPSTLTCTAPSAQPPPQPSASSPFRHPLHGLPYSGPPLPPSDQQFFPNLSPYPYPHRPSYIIPPPYWHHVPHINNPPPMSAPTHSIQSWSDNPHLFGPPPNLLPAHTQSAPPQTITFSEIYTPSNPPPTPQVSEAEEIYVPGVDEFDLTNFEFGMEMGMGVGEMMMESQFGVHDTDEGLVKEGNGRLEMEKGK